MTHCLILTYSSFILEKKLCSWSPHGPTHAYKIHEDGCSLELSQSLRQSFAFTLPQFQVSPNGTAKTSSFPCSPVFHQVHNWPHLKNPQLCVCDKPLHTSRNRDQEVENRARERDSDRVKFENSQQLSSVIS